MMQEEGPRPSEAYAALILQDVHALASDFEAGRIDPADWSEEIESAAVRLSCLMGKTK